MPPNKINIPPLQPNSPQEIATFQSLDLALRSRPEFAREGATILNPKALSRLVEGIRYFQETHLGRKAKTAKSKQWPLIRLPDEIFRSRNSDGPLFTVFLSCYRQKKESSWRQFDFVSPKRFEDNVALMKRIEKDLISSGHLVRPIVYFDGSVAKDRQDEYEQIIIRYGGKVVKNPNGTGENAPTHVVAWDSDEHDSEDTLVDETKVSEEGRERDKVYLKSLIVVDPSKKKNIGAGGIIETTMADSKKKGGKVKGGKNAAPVIDFPLALVHWWYFPPSFDEWMPASDVAGEAENDLLSRPPNRPWAVSCKFIRDVDHFNEWGMEADYAIVDYEKKVAFFKNLAKIEQAKIAHIKKEASRRKKNDGDPLRIRLSIPSSSLVLKSVADVKNKRNQGMNPRQIFTGFYNENGTKLRRTVYNGAVKIPPVASELMNGATKHWDKNIKNDNSSGKVAISFPSVDTVLRPSRDKMYSKTFLVTELRTGQAGGTIISSSLKPFTAPVLVPPHRIRGGGGMNDNDVEMKDASTIDGNNLTKLDPPGTKLNDDGTLNEDQRAKNIARSISVEERTHTVRSDTLSTAQDTKIGDHPDAQQGRLSNVNADTSSKELSCSSKEESKSIKLEEQPSSINTIKDSNVSSKETISPISKGPNSQPVTDPTITAQAMKDGIEKEKTENQLKIPTPSTNVSNKAEVPSLDKLPPKAKSQVPKNPQTLIPGMETKTQDSLIADQIPTVAKPLWYDSKSVSDFEKRFLPEWFNKSSLHRCQSSYITAREKIIDVARHSNNKYVTSTAIRRCVSGDAGSLLRLHKFLVDWGFINGSAIGDSAPTTWELTNAAYNSTLQNQTSLGKWANEKKCRLVAAVASHTSKKRKINGEETDSKMSINWDLIAKEVGENTTAFDCHREFLSTDFDSRSAMNQDITIETQTKKKEVSLKRQHIVRGIVGDVRPDVLSATISEAMKASDFDSNEAQKAALLGIVASQAEEKAYKEEAAISDLLQKILDQRMSKLENRLSVLDDIEGMFDAERLALELERRDLYTARCRQWFAGDK